MVNILRLSYKCFQIELVNYFECISFVKSYFFKDLMVYTMGIVANFSISLEILYGTRY